MRKSILVFLITATCFGQTQTYPPLASSGSPLAGAVNGTTGANTLRDFVSVKDYGARGDGQSVSDAAITTGTPNLSSASAVFTQADVGKKCIVMQVTVLSAVQSFTCTILTVTDAHNVVLDTNANFSYVNAAFEWATDDRTAIMNAQAALPNGGTLFFPHGRYGILSASGIVLNQSNIEYRGEGMYSSVLVGLAGTGGQLVESSSALISNIKFTNLGFDAVNTSVNEITITGTQVTGPVSIDSCRFFRMSTAITLTGMQNVDIHNSAFDMPGGNFSVGNGIVINGSSKNIRITQNRFWMFRNAISTASSTGTVVSRLMIENNYFDGGFFMLPTGYTNSGGTVTYAAKTLTDSAATFGAIPAATFVRALVSAQTGTGVSADSGMGLTDASANFTGNNVARGYYIVMGNYVAFVENVISATHLVVDRWLNKTTRMPEPATYGAYTVYQMLLAQVTSNTGTALTMLYDWKDWNGVETTPAAGTLYEVQVGTGTYPIQCDSLYCQDMQVIGNTIRRARADFISTFGVRSTIVGNVLEDGADTGITLQGGDHHTVTGNSIRHMGAQGIAIGSTYSVISNNNVREVPWLNEQATGLGEFVLIKPSDHNTISNNIGDGVNSALTLRRWGLTAISASGGNITANRIFGNSFYNHNAADIEFSGAAVTANEVWGNLGTISSLNSATYTSQVPGTSLPIDLSTDCYHEPFMPGSQSSGSIGTLGWTMNTIVAAPNVTALAGSGARSGVVRFNTAATSGNGGVLDLSFGLSASGPFNNLSTSYPWTSSWVFDSDTITAVRLRIGYMVSGSTTAVPVSGIYACFDNVSGCGAGADTTHWNFCSTAASTEVCYVTSAVPIADYYSLLIRQVSSGTIGFTLKDASGVISVTEKTICPSGCDATATPVATAQTPAVDLLTGTNAASHARLDDWQFCWTGLAR